MHVYHMGFAPVSHEVSSMFKYYARPEVCYESVSSIHSIICIKTVLNIFSIKRDK